MGREEEQTMSTKRRTGSLIVLLIALSLVFGACGGDGGAVDSPDGEATTTAAGGEPRTVDLTFWTFVAAHAEFMEAQAAEWNAANPNVQITISATTQDYTVMHDQLAIALQSGTGAPDLVDIEISKFGIFTRGEIQLHDLTEIVERNSENLVVERLAPYQVGGVAYGIDYHLGAFLMYYNSEVLDAAGVDPDSIVTWDDYIEAGKTVVAETGVPMAAVETGSGFSLQAVILQNGGGRYDADNALILDSAANVEAAQMVQDMIHVDEIAVPAPGTHFHDPNFYGFFNGGGAASLWMPQWYMIRFPENMPDLEGKMIVRPLPAFEEGGAVSTMGGGTGTAITNQTPDDEVQVARDFLEFAKLTYDAQVKLWTVLGFDPFRIDVYEDPALQEPDPWFSNEPVMANIAKMFDSITPEYTGPRYPEISTLMGEVIAAEIFDQGLPPDEVLTRAADEIRDLD
jgi:arabinosaccharide transport system substrate-binding protein